MDRTKHNWKYKLHEIIYEADTPGGKLFDILLLISIVTSILLVMLESVPSINIKHGQFFHISEWVITILFTIEYILRVISIKKPKHYIFSYYGIIDLLSTIPKYLAIFIGGAHALVVLRSLRLLRVFRVLKITRYIGESNKLLFALRASRPKIIVFVFAVLIICLILGSVMYIVEADAGSGFISIPRSVYWTIVTLTTVGYGDIAPVTTIGQIIASIVMILGYGIIAVPTGIVSAEYTSHFKKTHTNTKTCDTCGTERHNDNAKFCHKCGVKF